MTTISCAGLTDPGRVRSLNEDAWFAADDGRVCAVADGMGGHAHGELASALAMESFQRRLGLLAVDVDSTMPLDLNGPPAIDGDRLKEAVEQANWAVYRYRLDNRIDSVMGTTFVAAAVAGSSLWIAHVGDSRAYRLRNDRLQLLTRDHSLVWQLYEQGSISFEEMSTHKKKNVITRALGVNAEVTVDVTHDDFFTGDLIVLCSDGLHGMLGDRDLETVLREEDLSSLAQTARTLVDRANERGGADNISVVLLKGA